MGGMVFPIASSDFAPRRSGRGVGEAADVKVEPAEGRASVETQLATSRATCFDVRACLPLCARLPRCPRQSYRKAFPPHGGKPHSRENATAPAFRCVPRTTRAIHRNG